MATTFIREREGKGVGKLGFLLSEFDVTAVWPCGLPDPANEGFIADRAQ